MRLSWLLSLPAILAPASAIPIEKRDADFFSVRTKMHTDMSGRRGDPAGKYFRESARQQLSRAQSPFRVWGQERLLTDRAYRREHVS
jgi:hypothetical protein